MAFSAAKGGSYPSAYYKSITTKGAMHVSSKSNLGATDQNSSLSINSSENSNLQRRISLTSFPSSRSPSVMSRRSRPSRSPNPPRIDTDRYSDHNSNTKTPSSIFSSQHSSLSAPQKFNADAHPRRKLRSQYPLGKTENHVEYILVASFDIDRGPIMEHQFPVAITGDETMLAELMLPDQAHVRNQDWTIFFLHKDNSQAEQEAELKERRKRQRQRKQDRMAGFLDSNSWESGDDDDDVDDDEDELGDDYFKNDSSEDESDRYELEGAEGPPLIYVLNLVNTKQDKTAKRGAVVKAMAICTRHPFLHIYKPLLLLALDEYFKAPHPTTLARLWDAVNSMDLSLMPKLGRLERTLLQGSDNKDLFVEKFEQMIQMRIADERGEMSSDTAHLSMSKIPENRPDLIRNGTSAHVKGHSVYSVPRDTHEFETKVHYNGIPIPIKVPVALSPETVGDFSLIKLIQTFGEPHLKCPQPFALHPHLTTNGLFTHPIIVLVNAILTQKRVIFLGYNRPSGEVAEAVLAACALSSGGILRGFTRHAFPYTDLSKIDDLLKIPGFLAGVTNPAFENHPEWWDVLCDIPSGRIKISNKIEAAPSTEGLRNFKSQNPAYAAMIGSASLLASDPNGDIAFMNDVTRSIVARHGEGVIRAKWHDWVGKFSRVAAAFEEKVYGISSLCIGSELRDCSNEVIAGHGYVWPDETSKMRELAASIYRIEGWRNTRSYVSFKHDLARLYDNRPFKTLDLNHLHDRLRTTKLTSEASREIYLTLAKYINSYDEVCQLLAVTPESHAGLFYLALGLFHKEKKVRLKVVELLERISEHEAGRHWWKSLSNFEKLAFYRLRRDADAELRHNTERKYTHRSQTSVDE
ncbi:Protein mesA [Golovinomyces cichoracearum]|uniref:Protein mesA n=1 Tax=Golovinomyces cichoracearum TaxID=62708 RepID=A0A420I147_9PEZI|nr:Protein mesA [Golovinomyces cichoracearum]